jgi:hypothetical protein
MKPRVAGGELPGDIMHLYRHALVSYVQQPSGHWLKNEQDAAGMC